MKGGQLRWQGQSNLTFLGPGPSRGVDYILDKQSVNGGGEISWVPWVKSLRNASLVQESLWVQTAIPDKLSLLN